MKTKMSVVAIIALSIVIACRAQEVAKDHKKNDTANRPKESWKVNKKLDDKGNVVSYDSSYSWSYSTNGADDPANIDSIFNSFDAGWSKQLSLLFNDQWDFSFPTDSFFHNQFPGSDTLYGAMDRHMRELEKMMLQMQQEKPHMMEPFRETPDVKLYKSL